MKDATRLVHEGRRSAEHHGVVNTPVYRASTILHPTLADLEGNTQTYGYGRRGTPTTRSLEEAICALEGGARTLLTPSGLSAVNAALMGALSAGDHLLIPDSVYGPTRAFCKGPLRRFGVETSAYDPRASAEQVASMFRPNTKAILLESPGSITFEVQDLPAICVAARAAGVTSLVDNTWATPLYCKPLALGADVAILAATKYVVGHADALIGTITSNDELAPKMLDFHGTFGLSVSGDDAYLTLRGLRTMGVRLARHQETGLRLAHWLAQRPEVEAVLHPALEASPDHALWRRDFTGASGLFGVVLKPVRHEAVAAMLDGLRLFGMGWSWGGFESLIVASRPSRKVAPLPWTGPILRVHAGLEDPDDLLADLDAGFARLDAAA